MSRKEIKMPMKDELGHRMKEYEARETQRTFLPYLPVYARIDGRGFSKFTRHAEKPFDTSIYHAMEAATIALVRETKANIGYFQSDEISLVWETTAPNEEMFFKGKVQKMTSVLAGLATAAFMRALVADVAWEKQSPGWIDRLPHFDARVLQLPNRTEAANMFVWRESDARKNAISMVARAHFSHKALQNKTGREMIAMLAEKGIAFEGYGERYRRGTFVRRVTREVEIPERERLAIPERHRPAVGTKVTRTEVVPLVFPPFNTVANRNEVIFEGAEPLLPEQMPFAQEWHG